MFKKIGLIILNIILIIILVLAFLKLISFLPASKLQPILANKLVFLQQAERDLEAFFNRVGVTYRQVVLNKQEEQKFKVLYFNSLAEQRLNAALVYENKVLNSKLGFMQNYEYRLEPAEIISRGADNWFNFIILNKGARQGIKKDMEVINEQGLVGYAYTVFPESTKVILLTDPLVQISCINQRNKEIGILAGQLNKPLMLNYISSNSDVQEGDMLLTSGHSLRYRRGLPVAKVIKTNNVRNNYYKNVQAELLVDLSKLDIVFFIK